MAQHDGKCKVRLVGANNGQKPQFCIICKRLTCLKTKKVCVRLEKFLVKKVEIKFWHGVESYLPSATFNLMQDLLYSVENKRDTKDYEDFKHIWRHTGDE